MDGSICRHDASLADCSECILLSAGVPLSNYPPLIRAARHPDISPLQSLLKNLPAARLDLGRVTWPSSEIFNNDYGVWKSPLTEAILAGLPGNVALLLEYHADPDGFPNYLYRRFSSCFVRHRPLYLYADTFGSWPPRENLLETISSPQTGPLTENEIEARRSFRCRFWAEKDFPSLRSASRGPITALEAAATMGDQETFARLVQAGADSTAWTTEHQLQMPDPAPPSYLTLSTPLHRAIESDNPAMIAYLLNSHHSPDYFPLSTITRSLNATMHLLTLPSPSPIILDLLLPATNLSARSPIYNCHILHIAAATLNLPLFQQIVSAVSPRVATNFSNLRPTALGHTPLHIACLPRDDSCINLHSQKIYASIHEVRTLSDTWQPRTLWSHPPHAVSTSARSTGRNLDPSPPEPKHPTPAPQTHPSTPHPAIAADADAIPPDLAAQSALVKYLLRTHYANPLAALADQDIHGNTPLHYLASARDFDERLWGWVCGMIKRWREAEAAKPGGQGEEQQQQQQQRGEGGERGAEREQSGKRSREKGEEGRGAADGYDPLIGIRNRWGYCPADLFLENREARAEWGREVMPFWRDGDEDGGLGSRI